VHAGVAKALASPELRERFTSDGGDALVRGPEEFAALIRTELVKWAKVVKDAGVRVD
jgi:tripartite-type tricarboxylate transporter receptor subunit TctC